MDPFESQEVSPRRMGKVRCNVCGKEFFDDLLVLNPQSNEWCCKDYPTCSGAGFDIVIADGRRKIDEAELRSKLEYDPSNPYPPPEVPVPVRCVMCLAFYMSNELQHVHGQWMCKYWPECEGYGYGLNIFDPNHSIFSIARKRDAHRKRSR